MSFIGHLLRLQLLDLVPHAINGQFPLESTPTGALPIFLQPSERIASFLLVLALVGVVCIRLACALSPARQFVFLRDGRTGTGGPALVLRSKRRFSGVVDPVRRRARRGSLTDAAKLGLSEALEGAAGRHCRTGSFSTGIRLGLQSLTAEGPKPGRSLNLVLAHQMETIMIII